MSLFDEHRRIIKRRWPALWKALSVAPALPSVEVSTGTPVSTLVVDGIHVTSSYDRMAEAQLQASAIAPSERSVRVYGFALGDLPRVLLARSSMEQVNVVILSPAVATQSLRHFDHRDWLDDERVELEIADEGSELRAPCVVAPAMLRLCHDAALALRDKLMLALAQPAQRRHFEALDELFATRVEENRPLLESDGDVSSLFDTSGGGQAVVVAAGPTLDDWLEWLRTRREERKVIAVSTALRPLQLRKISPDVVIVVDHRPGISRHFRHVAERYADQLRATPLVYAPVVDPEVLAAWPGPRLAASIEGQRTQLSRRNLPRGELFCSGTVTHAAVDLAVRMGVREVTILGADFGFPRQHSHVEGALTRRELPEGRGDEPPKTWVLDGHGQRMPSETNMVGYLRDLETYVASHPGVRFIKAGRDGAAIDGVGWLDEVQGP